MEMETRLCKTCMKKTFKVLASSKQKFCSKDCDLMYTKNSGNEELWKKRTRELLSNNRHFFLPNERDFVKSGGRNIIKEDSQTLTKSIPREKAKDITSEIKRASMKSDMLNTKIEKSPTLPMPNLNVSIKENGTEKIKTPTKRVPTEIIEKGTLSVELSPQLTLVKEVISTQMSYIDRSAELIMQRMEQLNKVKTGPDGEIIQNPSSLDTEQTIQLARTMNELMRTKKDAIKTVYDMVKGEKC